MAEALELLCETRSMPQIITIDHGTESTSKAFDEWTFGHDIKLLFTRAGKPTDNSFMESFNGHLGDECLNANEFLSIKDARD